MKRNLSRRIETIFPILDKDIRKNVQRMIDLQLNDNVKARIIDSRQKNKYVKNKIQIHIKIQKQICESSNTLTTRKLFPK